MSKKTTAAAKTVCAVKIDADLLRRLNEYKETTGIPIYHSINEAITDFLEVVVPARLVALGYSQIDKKSDPLQKNVA